MIRSALQKVSLNILEHTCVKINVCFNCTLADPGFSFGGANLLYWRFSAAKTYAKARELAPAGGAPGFANAMQCDLIF